MNADVLRSFFEGRAGAGALAGEAALAEARFSRGTHEVITADLAEEFTITPAHLVALCDAVAKGEVTACQLEVLASVMVHSEKFTWNPRSPEGARVSRVIYAWEAPEINYVLNGVTAAKFRRLLTTGEDTFTDADWSEKPGAL